MRATGLICINEHFHFHYQRKAVTTIARPRCIATIEARMTSSRLPGKVLMKAGNKPMLEILIERLKQAKRLDGIMVATTTNFQDDPIVHLSQQLGVGFFRGSEDDVMGRVLGALKCANADVCVEITGDCPLIDPMIVDAVLERYLQGGFDYVSNSLDSLTFPEGMDVQVFSTNLLESAVHSTNDPYDRENVSSYFYRNPSKFRLLNLQAPDDLNRPHYRLVLDYPEDLAVLLTIYQSLSPIDPFFGVRQITEFLDRRPDIVSKNNRMPNAFQGPSSNGASVQKTLFLKPKIQQ